MADVRIKVTTEELRNKATEISTQKATMEGLMTDMQKSVTKLQEVWKSDSGTKFQEQYVTVEKNIQTALDKLQKHATNLVDVATQFDEGNQQTVSTTGSLSTEQVMN
jgi:WXG100 family type VII secretion target